MGLSVESQELKLITAEAIKLMDEGDPLLDDVFIAKEMAYSLSLAKTLTKHMDVAYGYTKDVATSMTLSIDRNALYDAAERAYTEQLGVRAPETMRPIIDKHVNGIYNYARNAITEVSLTLPDKKSIEYLKSVDNFYVGKMFKGYEDQVREVIRNATFNDGLGAIDTAKLIREAVGGKVEREFYRYATVARTSANRVRNWSRVQAFQVEMVAEVEFIAMMDERTSDICENMDGAIFEVASIVEHIEKVQEAGEDRLPEVSPFPKLSDITGLNGNRLSERELEKLGFAVPPLHCNCRSLLAYSDPVVRSVLNDGEKIEYIESELERKKNLVSDFYGYQKHPHSLSPADADAIKLYTTSEYETFNKYLRGIDFRFTDKIANIEDLKSSIIDVNTALDRLPNVDTGIVSRIIYTGDYEARKANAVKDFVTRGFFSTTSKSIASDAGDARDSIIYHVLPRRGKYIEKYSAFPQEREVLFKPGSAFRVLKTEEKFETYSSVTYKTLIVYAEEL
jgi:SPP1 gp7 family putative phage head morphogenesis protein